MKKSLYKERIPAPEGTHRAVLVDYVVPGIPETKSSRRCTIALVFEIENDFCLDPFHKLKLFLWRIEVAVLDMRKKFFHLLDDLMHSHRSSKLGSSRHKFPIS